MAAPVIWAAIIFILYSLPSSVIKYDPSWDFFRVDKLVHFFLFFVWTIILSVLFVKLPNVFLQKYHSIIATIFSLIYGGVLEFFQEDWFPSRNSDPWDMAANAVGALLGLILFRKIFSKIQFYLR